MTGRVGGGTLPWPPMWDYVAVALCAFVCLSGLTGLGLARVLGVIGREISDLHEREYWADWDPRGL